MISNRLGASKPPDVEIFRWAMYGGMERSDASIPAELSTAQICVVEMSSFPLR